MSIILELVKEMQERFGSSNILKKPIVAIKKRSDGVEMYAVYVKFYSIVARHTKEKIAIMSNLE